MIRNIPKKTKIKVYKNPLLQAFGLMFSRKRKDFALIFDFKKEKKECFHMFFVFYTINLIFLDKNKKVVEIKENFKPFRIYFAKAKARYVIESAKKIKCRIGDAIKF